MLSIEQVLHFWFDETEPKQWFVKSPAFDARVREQLLAGHEAAVAGKLESWQASANGCLALCILLDQAPRNLFRGSARAFASDAQARAVAETALALGFDQGLSVNQRLFLYLPFEHSESLADQARSVALFSAMDNAGYAEYARRHQAVIVRFGRFPHRNAALGRQSSAEELAYLAEPGAGF